MRISFLLILGFLLITAFGFGQQPNDHIFPASAKAKKFIDFDRRGFLLGGQREFLVSAGMEYARVPHELWKDRLLRLKNAGFNCIEIYTFWNFHEPQEGKFEFSGDHDLDAFLKLAKNMGLYVIARVGPYYCAEWDNGGYPLWLRFKKGLRVREHNPAFEKYTDLFWDTLMPIVCRNQISRGGSVIMVQLENEHPAGWGTDMPDDYFRHLRQKALSFGLEVPYFFSGLHHAGDPAGDGNQDDSTRPNPWLSTEFWCVGFDRYGSTEKDARNYERRTWHIIARGGNGYNYYMAHGGSNFGYNNNDEDAASYDYGAAVGQAGDLRPLYASFKRTAFFTRSFQSILENSLVTDIYNRSFEDTAVHINARQSPAGEIIFLDNPTADSRPAKLRSGDASGFPAEPEIVLSPGEILPVIHHFRLNPSVSLEWGISHILDVSHQGNTSTLVIYGRPGSAASLVFSTRGKMKTGKDNAAVSIHGQELRLIPSFPEEDKPLLYSFSVADQHVEVLAVNERLSGRTWCFTHEGKRLVVVGPQFVSSVTETAQNTEVITERPWQEKTAPASWILSGRTLKNLRPEIPPPPDGAKELTLSSWEIKNAEEPASPLFDDSHWKASADPLQMGADGDLTAEAWYRTRIDVAESGSYTLQAKGGDRARIYVDGQMVSAVDLKNGEISLTLTKGKHVLAIFTAHNGRDKLAAYLGPIDEVAAKGIFGRALLVRGKNNVQNLTGWMFLKAASAKDLDQGIPSQQNGSWQKYRIGDDAFQLREGYGWFSTLLDNPPEGAKELQLEFTSVDEDATVFLNGIRLGSHRGWNSPFHLEFDRVDTLKRPLILTAFIENHSKEGGIDQPVHASYLLPSTRILTGWRMRGGIGDVGQILGNWRPMEKSGSATGPCFFRASFHFSKKTGSLPVYRVLTTGLGHGSVWVNGHNLGRYPEKIPVNGIYIPECWLKEGINFLWIYDEDGHSPDQVSITAEEAASRWIERLHSF